MGVRVMVSLTLPDADLDTFVPDQLQWEISRALSYVNSGATYYDYPQLKRINAAQVIDVEFVDVERPVTLDVTVAEESVLRQYLATYRATRLTLSEPDSAAPTTVPASDLPQREPGSLLGSAGGGYVQGY